MATDRDTPVDTPLDNRAASEEGVGKVVVLEGTELMIHSTVLSFVKEFIQIFVAVLGSRFLQT